jgi:hypothetical protein
MTFVTFTLRAFTNPETHEIVPQRKLTVALDCIEALEDFKEHGKLHLKGGKYHFVVENNDQVKLWEYYS